MVQNTLRNFTIITLVLRESAHLLYIWFAYKYMFEMVGAGAEVLAMIQIVSKVELPEWH